MQLTRYLKIYPCADKPGRSLLLATRRCAVLECSDRLLERLCSGGELSQKELDTFTRLGVLVADRAAERAELLATFEDANRKSKTLGGIEGRSCFIALCLFLCYQISHAKTSPIRHSRFIAARHFSRY